MGSATTPSRATAAAALTTPLAGLDGRVHRLGTLAGTGPRLVVVVERDCPTSNGALRALAADGVPALIVSQGRPEAARDLVAATGVDAGSVLVEPAPHPVSEALGAATVPSFALLRGGEVVELAEGWDRQRVVALVAATGASLTGDGGLGEHRPGCQSRHTFDADLQRRLEADDAALAGDEGRVEDLWELGWHDGLPVVPPTRTRVRAMLDGRDPASSLGLLGPVMGEVTFERLAACAVLAGCHPDHWPVVEAAARAVLDDAFNPHGVTNTTGFASPWIVVNGPVRTRLGMNAASNVLGPGNRANATIGRAVRLLLQLTGGGSPGGLDQSALGGQHKFTACFPEREEVSPFEPLHVHLGHDPDASTVTVLAGGPPAEVTDNTSQTPEQLVATLSLALGNAGAPTLYPIPGHRTLLVLGTEHARTFGEAGWDRRRLTGALVERTVRTVGELRATGSGALTPTVAAAEDPDLVVPKFGSPDQLAIVVAGGDAGRCSVVVSPWSPSSRPVTREVGA